MLTDVRCRTAKPKEKPYKLSDAHGLYLYVMPSGTRSWRLKYRFGGKEHRLTFGTYPDMTLVEAREAREAARKLLREGTNPKVDKKQRQAVAAIENGNTFEAIARQWHAQQEKIRAQRYAGQILDRLEADAFPAIGALPIKAITPALLLALIRAIEGRGAIEMAHRVRQHISSVFVFAIGAGWAEANPAATIQPVLEPRRKTLRPAMLKIEQARKVLRDVESQEDAYVVTKLASRMLALTVVRPGVLRLAEPKEFEDLDGKSPIWRIPAAKMKLTRERKQDASYEFVVPLSAQAVETAKAAMELAGAKPLLFPSVRYVDRPITDSTLSKLYRTAGYAGKHVPHGWRATFSTVMNELAGRENRVGDREVIDLMLAHIQEGVEAAYNRAAYMPRRRELAQEWADMLMTAMPPASALLKG
ncbi:integrase [Sphingobium wenxiniae]|uniref:Phage integrase family protein n=1 Tax=Sphingobium wenxiniae (strain DSM 21828 / CGMCC 1.7748 / JZ-1) TaxID=595605 RepID=A0A562KKT3_SPHWJ|nr:integrase arm-type DNA-binding domain-containing protein [Sphingobium wenxiniae]MBB6191217.1 integrase [Sphingobium wenxiniae]TWH95986.1 phage integrase family protein [Sphingobium wenxiniae]